MKKLEDKTLRATKRALVTNKKRKRGKIGSKLKHILLKDKIARITQHIPQITGKRRRHQLKQKLHKMSTYKKIVLAKDQSKKEKEKSRAGSIVKLSGDDSFPPNRRFLFLGQWHSGGRNSKTPHFTRHLVAPFLV